MHNESEYLSAPRQKRTPRAADIDQLLNNAWDALNATYGTSSKDLDEEQFAAQEERTLAITKTALRRGKGHPLAFQIRERIVQIAFRNGEPHAFDYAANELYQPPYQTTAGRNFQPETYKAWMEHAKEIVATLQRYARRLTPEQKKQLHTLVERIETMHRELEEAIDQEVQRKRMAEVMGTLSPPSLNGNGVLHSEHEYQGDGEEDVA